MMKPECAIFDQMQRALDLDHEHAILIDDNVDAARRLGWKVLHFVSAEQCGADLMRDGWF